MFESSAELKMVKINTKMLEISLLRAVSNIRGHPCLNSVDEDHSALFPEVISNSRILSALRDMLPIYFALFMDKSFGLTLQSVTMQELLCRKAQDYVLLKLCASQKHQLN